MNLLHRPVSAIRTAPLLAAELALALAAAPLFGRMAAWVVALFFGTCAARLLMNLPGAHLLSLPMKVVLFGAGAGGIALTYGTALGIEPGFSIILLLVSLKLLETNTVRDFQVVALLGFFLALCDLFFTQSFTVWLFVAAITVLLTAALVHFHRGESAGGFRGALRRGGVLLLQALPVVVLLFVFFPRSQQQFVMQFSQPLTGRGGMSDSLSPGSIASLALGRELVFTAEFPRGQMPSMSVMYWRAGVLWRGEGLAWWLGQPLRPERRAVALGGTPVLQHIVLQPHGALWLYALDRPASEVRGAHMEVGGFLASNRPVLKPLRYDVLSRPDDREATLPADQRFRATEKPARISPHVQALVSAWRTAHADDRGLVDAALHYFRNERFTYTLTPGTYDGGDPLDDFLFQRRAGFCEHYAAAFASLMRIAGIPSRVVLGYHGGEYNALGHYVIVRQSDAHAWCEVWIKGEGWERVDPTEMIAPDRLSSGLDTFLENRAAADPNAAQRSAAATGWRELRRELRLVWDDVNYQWDLRVLGYDEDTQRNVLAGLGFGDFGWLETGVWVAVVIALLLGSIGLWQRRPGRPPLDEAGRAYARFCRALAAAGLPREPWEGPHRFGERAAAHFAAHAAAIREITALYARLRYAPDAPPAADFLRALRALPRLRGEKTERGCRGS